MASCRAGSGKGGGRIVEDERPVVAGRGLARRVEASAAAIGEGADRRHGPRSEEHTSELQSLMRISYAVFCLKKKTLESHSQLQSVHKLQTNSKTQLDAH